MRCYYTDHFELPLPAGHRFPMSKYARLRAAVAAAAQFEPCELLVAPAADDHQLRLAHTPEYVEQIVTGGLGPREARRIGFPWSPAMVERSRRSTGATIAAATAALTEGAAVNLAGGTHHAMPDSGEGYCVFNDAAVAIRTLQRAERIRRAIVIDCDVHQGNGTAEIFSADPSVFTLSLHGGRNFPFRKRASDLDVHLPDGTGDAEYLRLLGPTLRWCLEAAEPDLAVYVSGADPFEGDKLGRLRLTKAGLRERDRLVFAACLDRSLPVAVTMGGGYAPSVDDIVAIHLATVEEALRMQRRFSAPAPA